MRYTVKEIYYTLQGEGFHTGRAAVFLRFTGCNLWTGREADRTTAVCRFCDTEFDTVDPLTKADLRKQARRLEKVQSFKIIVIALFVISLPGCLAPIMAIVDAVVLLPQRDTLRRCGPAFMVMGYTALGLSVIYTILLGLFMLSEMMS